MSTKITPDIQTKPSWNNCEGCELVCVDHKEDWTQTKYKHPNIPEDHIIKTQPQKNTKIPGIVANKLFELANKKFIENKEYDYNQIYDMCGGVLWGVSERTEDTIEVTYMTYDHHNEPIETQKLCLIKSSKSEP